MSAKRDNHCDHIIDEVQLTYIILRTDDSRLQAVCSAWMLVIEVGEYYCPNVNKIRLLTELLRDPRLINVGRIACGLNISKLYLLGRLLRKLKLPCLTAGYHEFFVIKNFRP